MASTPVSSCRRPRRARESGTAANASTNEDVLTASPPATSAASATARWVGRSAGNATGAGSGAWSMTAQRSEEHTSELQSQSNLVCRLLLEKKKRNNRTQLALHVSDER